MKSFYHFNNGVKISDTTINKWIWQCLDEITKGKSHTAISSGDTTVSAHVWKSMTEIFVSTSDGRSTIHFYNDEPFIFEPYTRPKG